LSEKLLTILTAPKAFKDSHITTIQRNALRSWQALGERVDILILGNDEGIAGNTARLGVRHYPQVKCNSRGTPLISSMLEIARSESRSPFLAIINTDIVVFPDVLDALKRTAEKWSSFILIGQRWDMDINYELKTDTASLAQLNTQVQSAGRLHPPMGSDYFIFPRECYTAIPDLAIGRAGWDNWFIFKSRWEGWVVVDATHDITIIHQSHDYSHLPGGQPHYRLPETRENVEQAGGEHTIFTLFDAQVELVDGVFRRKRFTLHKLVREIEIFPLIHLHSLPLGKVYYFLFHPIKAYRSFRSIFLKKNHHR